MILEAVPNTVSSLNESVKKAVCDLLNVVRDQYVKDYGESDSDDENKSHLGFASIRRLLCDFKTPISGVTTEEKLNWLCDEANLTKTGSKQRSSLLISIKSCCTSLRTLNTRGTLATMLDNSEQEKLTNKIWDTHLFRDAERFHDTLSKTWDCTCFEDQKHLDAVFSFHSPPASEDLSTAGTIYFRTEQGGAVGWRRAQFEYQRRSPLQTDLENHKSNWQTQDCEMMTEGLCAALESVSEGDCVRITCGTRVSRSRARAKMAMRALIAEAPLTSCFELRPDHPVYKLSPKRRMMLALYLAYAYLHLSGGCWWPYTARSCVKLPNLIDPAAPPSAFFAAALLSEREALVSVAKFEIVEHLNRDMPSLVAFGRLLLQLFLGRAIIWDLVPEELENCAEYAFAAEVTSAVKACLRPSELRAPEEPGTIRESERLRNSFIKSVVVPIQYVVQVGFKVQAQDIFPIPMAMKRAPPPAPRSTREVKSILVMPGCAKVIDKGFCLHDGQDEPEKLDDQR